MLRSLALAVSLVSATGPAAQRPEVTVSAAASLTDVLQEVAANHQRQGGAHVVLNLAASNTLARQIVAGAKVDVFISADEAQMAAVANYVEPASRVELLSNQLAIAVPSDRPRTLASARDLTDTAIRRIAIGDPAAVPAGVYARQYLEKLGVWNAVESKVVPSGSVRLALAAVENGAADAAIVYKTDIAAAKRAHEALVVPAAEGPRIIYPAAVIRGGANPEGARRFLAFLQAAESRRVFEKAGFLKP